MNARALSLSVCCLVDAAPSLSRAAERLGVASQPDLRPVAEPDLPRSFIGPSTSRQTTSTTSRPINTNVEMSSLFPRHFSRQRSTRKRKAAVKKCREIIRRFVCPPDRGPRFGRAESSIDCRIG